MGFGLWSRTRHRGLGRSHHAGESRGLAELENGSCSSGLYNWLKRDSAQTMPLFFAGRPKEDFFTYYEQVSPELAAHLRRFGSLHFSDWYFNRAIYHVRLAMAIDGTPRKDGKAFSRGLDYWVKAASKQLLQWSKLVAKEEPGDFGARGLLPSQPSHDHELLLTLVDAPDDLLHIIKKVALELTSGARPRTRSSAARGFRATTIADLRRNPRTAEGRPRRRSGSGPAE
jgi:hypothetical protein